MSKATANQDDEQMMDDDEADADFGGLSDADLSDLIPGGRYTAEVIEVGEKKEGAAGPYRRVSLKIVDDETYTGRRVSFVASFGQNSLPMTYKRLSACLGRPLPRGPIYPNLYDEMLGNRVKITIKQGEYNGEPTNDVSSISADGAAPTGAPSASARAKAGQKQGLF